MRCSPGQMGNPITCGLIVDLFLEVRDSSLQNNKKKKKNWCELLIFGDINHSLPLLQ